MIQHSILSSQFKTLGIVLMIIKILEIWRISSDKWGGLMQNELKWY